MVVHQHLAPLGKPGQGEHPPDVSPRRHPRRLHNPVVVELAHEADFAALSEPDGGLYREGSFGGETVSRHGAKYTE